MYELHRAIVAGYFDTIKPPSVEGSRNDQKPTLDELRNKSERRQRRRNDCDTGAADSGIEIRNARPRGGLITILAVISLYKFIVVNICIFSYVFVPTLPTTNLIVGKRHQVN